MTTAIAATASSTALAQLTAESTELRPITDGASIAAFAERVASMSKQLRATGQRQLRMLRQTSADVDRAIVSAACEVPCAPVRMAKVRTLATTMRMASALMTLPPMLAGEAAGVLTGLAGADCYGDPERLEIVVGAEVIEALDDAEVTLDDAVVIAGLERRDSRAALSRGRPAVETVAAIEAEIKALSELHQATLAAAQLITRADQLIDDLDRLPRLLRIVS